MTKKNISSNIKSTKRVLKILNRHTNQITPHTFPKFEKCMRSHCSKEYLEYEEKLPRHTRKIEKCIGDKSSKKMNLSKQNRCLFKIIEPLMESLSKCSEKKCHHEESLFKKEMRTHKKFI